MSRFISFAFSLFAVFFISFNNSMFNQKIPGAAKALDSWFASRSFPEGVIDMKRYSDSYETFILQQVSQRSQTVPPPWVALGPMNFGGRTLCLAFNPQNANTIYAGSASGGLWRSYSAGVGATAWEFIPTGFPVLGVGAIAINPNDSNEIYIGTGEVYNYQNTGTGFAVRTTRGTYGIGILKSNDGGATWSKSLDWQYDELKGVQDIIINPVNPNTVFAATSEGIYRTFDAGVNWTLVHSVLMAADLNMMPNDTSTIIAGVGNSGTANNGIYKTSDGGNTWVKQTIGLPSTTTGKTLISISESSPNIVYASVADQLIQIGLYRSMDYGTSWTQVSTEDVCKYQGWYSHDVAVHPDYPDTLIFVGIDAWKSTDGGTTVVQKGYWYNWDFSATPIGGPEGPPDYVHADIHRVLYHPTNHDIIYYATDGGVFRSLDGGETFEGCNGMYHTQQFYANFSCSTTDSLFAIGGMQDNATAVWEGNPSCRRVIGGDGLSTAIDPTDDNIVFGSSQNLNLDLSLDKAQTFNGISLPSGGGTPNFAGPYAMSESNTSVLYAGARKIFKTVDQGNNWTTTNNNNNIDGNPILYITVSPTSSNVVYASTTPTVIPSAKLFKTTNGGTSWTDVTGTLPNRYMMDIAVNPSNSNIVYVVLGGFGTAHLFRSLNAGSTWSAWGAGLPDVPANCITIDPLNDSILYIGNDFGVYVSIDGGSTWNTYTDGLDDATLVFDITISPSNRKLRLATHGKGIWERDMLPPAYTGISESTVEVVNMSVYPNPVDEAFTIPLAGIESWKVYDAGGRVVMQSSSNIAGHKTSGNPLPARVLKDGTYLLEAAAQGKRYASRFAVIHKK